MGLETNKVKYRNSWRLLRLKELCTRISDGVHFTPEYVSEGVPFISVKDIFGDKVNFEKCKYITKDAHKELIKRCFPEKDDILITKSGTIGRMALVPDKPEFSLFVSVALLKNKKDLISSKFLKYCLENFLNHINISQDIKGGLLKNFHLEDIRETLVPEVPLLEQQAIVTKIEELFSQLENGKQQLLTAQKQLKTYRQSLLKWAFEGKLTNQNLKAGELPKGWEVKKLGGVCKLKNGFAFKSDDYRSEGVPVIRISDINDGIVSSEDTVRVESQDEYENYLVETNDILVAMSGATTGKFGIFKSANKAYQNQRVGKFKILDEKVLNNQFLFYQINSLKRQIEKDAYGGAQPNISSAKIEQMQITLPPLTEQQAIVTILESKLTICDKIEETINTSLKQSETLRQSILKKAFEGRLV